MRFVGAEASYMDDHAPVRRAPETPYVGAFIVRIMTSLHEGEAMWHIIAHRRVFETRATLART